MRLILISIALMVAACSSSEGLTEDEYQELELITNSTEFRLEDGPAPLVTIDERGNATIGEITALDMANLIEELCPVQRHVIGARDDIATLAVLRLVVDGFSEEFDRRCPERILWTEDSER